jgi:hypothetical protein
MLPPYLSFARWHCLHRWHRNLDLQQLLVCSLFMYAGNPVLSQLGNTRQTLSSVQGGKLLNQRDADIVFQWYAKMFHQKNKNRPRLVWIQIWPGSFFRYPELFVRAEQCVGMGRNDEQNFQLIDAAEERVVVCQNQSREVSLACTRQLELKVAGSSPSVPLFFWGYFSFGHGPAGNHQLVAGDLMEDGTIIRIRLGSG